MTKPVIIKREIKGTPLTYAELDANFQNLDDATINFTGDAGNTRSMDLNDTTSITGERNIKVTVDESTQTIKIRNTLSDYSLDPNGFENRTDSTISFNSSTRVFTIAPAVATYNIWSMGQQYAITTTKTVTITNTTGLYLVYFTNDTLSFAQDGDPSWTTQVPVSYVYWNAATSEYLFTDERHGIRMDASTKEYLHETTSLAYAYGFNASNYTVVGTGANNSDAQIDIGDGACYDQDLKVAITHSNSPTANTWEQDLQGPARIPVVYISGSTGAWRVDTARDYPFKNGTSLVTYNLNTTGTWTTPDCTSTYYVAYWIVATNFVNTPIIAVMGQRQDNKLSDAIINNTWNSLTLTNFPAEEFHPLYRIIVRTGSSYANTPKAYFAQVDDYRYVLTGGELGGGGTSGLTDIVNDTSPQLGGDLDVNGHSIVSVSNGNISIVPNGTGNILLTPATGHVTLSATNFPTGTGTTGQALVTDGAGQASWSTVGSGTVSSGTALTLARYASNGTTVSSSTLSFNDAGTTSTLTVTGSDDLKIGTTNSYTTFANGGNQTSSATGNISLSGTTGMTLNVGNSSTTGMSLVSNGGGMSLTTYSSGNLSLTAAGNLTLSATGTFSVDKTMSSTTAAGVAFLDRSASAASYANGATVNFSNFSGMVMINRQDVGSGNVALWLCGSGATLKLGDSIGNQSGTIASNGAVNGYTWTNDTGGTITCSFMAFKGRAAG